jgi:hypothetical protein
MFFYTLVFLVGAVIGYILRDRIAAEDKKALAFVEAEYNKLRNALKAKATQATTAETAVKKAL